MSKSTSFRASNKTFFHVSPTIDYETVLSMAFLARSVYKLGVSSKYGCAVVKWESDNFQKQRPYFLVCFWRPGLRGYTTRRAARKQERKCGLSFTKSYYCLRAGLLIFLGRGCSSEHFYRTPKRYKSGRGSCRSISNRKMNHPNTQLY